MANILDIATYVLEQTGNVSTMKLQKLVYYSQAFCLVTTNTPLFENRIEAWANGPVVCDLYDAHRLKYVVDSSSFNRSNVADKLSESNKKTINHVVDVLGSFSGEQLSKLTHSERPWQDARLGLPAGSHSNAEITKEAIKTFYGSYECKNPVFA